MKFFDGGLGEKHKLLSAIIKRSDRLDEAKALFAEIHSQLNSAKVYSLSEPTMQDSLFSGFTREDYSTIAEKSSENAAWVVWHITRIEDLTINMLVAQDEQVFNAAWQNRIGAEFTDTGNALSGDEIYSFGQTADIDALFEYRDEVAARTRSTVEKLDTTDMRRRVDPYDTGRIIQEHGVTSDENSIWLAEYWGGKDVAGLLLMPPTRHVIMHYNACAKWKEKINSGKKLYRV